MIEKSEEQGVLEDLQTLVDYQMTEFYRTYADSPRRRHSGGRRPAVALGGVGGAGRRLAMMGSVGLLVTQTCRAVSGFV